MLKNIGIKEIIAALGFLTGAITFVYGLGFKNANKDNRNLILESKVDMLVKNDSLKTMQFEVFMQLMNEQKTSLDTYVNQQKALVKNYSQFVQDNTKSVQEWKTYMNGLTFEIVSSKFPDTKILIQPIK
jgi:hypothetical protein